MCVLGSEKPAFESAVVSGYRSAMPHGLPTSKKLEKGDFVTFDFGATVDGYVCDITRTVVVGKATSRQKKIYDIVLKAQLAAIRKIIEERRAFWPLSDRQIHYALLNDPPLVHASKSGSVYRNDRRSYQALTDLLTRARVAGIIPMEVIEDATRPVTVWDVHADVQGFLRRELDGFCGNY